jgi:hypothetical protein
LVINRYLADGEKSSGSPERGPLDFDLREFTRRIAQPSSM